MRLSIFHGLVFSALSLLATSSAYAATEPGILTDFRNSAPGLRAEILTQIHQKSPREKNELLNDTLRFARSLPWHSETIYLKPAMIFAQELLPTPITHHKTIKQLTKLLMTGLTQPLFPTDESILTTPFLISRKPLLLMGRSLLTPAQRKKSATLEVLIPWERLKSIFVGLQVFVDIYALQTLSKISDADVVTNAERLRLRQFTESLVEDLLLALKLLIQMQELLVQIENRQWLWPSASPEKAQRLSAEFKIPEFILDFTRKITQLYPKNTILLELAHQSLQLLEQSNNRFILGHCPKVLQLQTPTPATHP